MNPAGLMSRSIVIHQKTPTTVGYSTNAATFTDTPVLGEFQQTVRDDDQTGSGAQDQTWALFLPPTVAIDSDDEVTVDGERYVVQGDPWFARNPRTQVVTHIEATVRQAG